MGGFGTVFAEGLAGAMAGAGQGAADQALLEEKDQMTALRDKRLSDLKTQEYRDQLSAQVDSAPKLIAAQTPGLIDRARQEADVKNRAAAGAPVTIPAGATRLVPGTQPAVTGYDDSGDALDASGNAIPPNAGTPDKTFTAPTKLSPGQEAYYQAHADEAKALTARYQAEADATAAGDRYRAQQGPQPKFTKDADGNLVDENTGAYRVRVPGPIIKPAETHFFGPDEAAKRGPDQYLWMDADGKPIPGGIASLYPKSQAARAHAGATPPAPASASSTSTDTAGSGVSPVAPTAAKAQSLGGYNGTSPPKKYPNATRAPDGFWYVKNSDGQFQLVLGQ